VLARAATGSPSERATAGPSLLSLLASDTQVSDILPRLHRGALDATGGSCTLLFEHNAHNAFLQATSGSGLDDLRLDPWLPSDSEHTLVIETFHQKLPTFVSDLERQMPELAARLSRPSCLLVPLTRGPEHLGLLAIGFDDAPQSTTLGDDISEVASAFQLALELFRSRQNEDVRREVHLLLDDFTSSLETASDIRGLDGFCHSACRLFAADRASVWIHDRRGRYLTVETSSDPEYQSRAVRISADDPFAPVALALRRTRPEIGPAANETGAQTLTIPLRGYRRAIGAFVLEGVRLEPGGELEWSDRADEIGRRLASAIETMQLIEEIVRSKRELEHAADAIGHLAVVTDRRGRIVHVNNAFAHRLNIPREQLIDRPLSECLGPEIAAHLADLERGVHAPGEEHIFEVVDSVLHSPLTVTVTDFLDRERRRAGLLLVARDRTPQVKLEAEREESRTRLRQSEKLAALGQFVAGIAHELNNPLQSVLGHLELLRATGAFPRQLRSEVQTIYREADRAAKIVRNLLIFAGSRRLARRPVSLNALIQRVVRARQAACRSQHIEIVRHYDEKLPRVKSDPLLLHQVFLNMVMNAEQAIVATGQPGRIEITTSVKADGQWLVATVRDSGGGIPHESRSRIFEPFYTTKEVGKGTGLGLAIAYGIIQDHGGQIGVSNHPDGGAIFTVELPSGPTA
jgi:signal transduction histidine kinase